MYSWSHFRKTPLKLSKRALGFSAFGTWPPGLSENLITPVDFDAFWRQNAEIVFKINEKALGKQGSHSGNTRSDKTFKNLGANKVLRRRKLHRKIHYKTCGIECLLEGKCGNDTQND